MEMGDMAFVRTLGVDATEDGLQITASTGLRGRGVQQESLPSLTLTGTGSSLSGAAVQVAAGCDQQVFYGYLDQLLLGEDYCASGILPALEYFARDVELGLGSEVWAVTGTAAEAIQGGGDQGVDSRLATLQLEHVQGTAGMTRTAGQLLTDILEDGATYLPRLISVEGSLLAAGYTIIIWDVQCGTLVDEGARGLELLEGDPAGDVFQGTSGVVAEVWEANCQATPLLVGDQLAGAVIHCTITANLAEYDRTPTDQEIEKLSEELARQSEERILSALEQLQQMGADAIQLGRQLGIQSTAHWADIAASWEGVFPTLPIWVTVDVTVERS